MNKKKWITMEEGFTRNRTRPSWDPNRTDISKTSKRCTSNSSSMRMSTIWTSCLTTRTTNTISLVLKTKMRKKEMILSNRWKRIMMMVKTLTSIIIRAFTPKRIMVKSISALKLVLILSQKTCASEFIKSLTKESHSNSICMAKECWWMELALRW